MIVNTITNPTRTSSKLNSSAMTVNITGTSFSFILDNLYTYPHRAIVRELSCNAWDAHVAAGNEAPFHIQVPSKLNPTLIIKDFGTGLDAEEIDKYLNTLYSSSKGETNDQIGGFGLGSKSPFALVPSFYITSIKDGKEYKCFWYRNSEGIPVLTVQSTKDTDQPNGLTYVVQFAEKDVDQIVQACASEVVGLPVPPLFFSDINDPSTMFDHLANSGLEKLHSTKDYAIITDNNNIILGTNQRLSYRSTFLGVSIGGVLYNLPNSFNTYDFLSKTAPSFSNLFEHGNRKVFMFKVPIGLIKLPSTREHILDTSENVEILKKYAEIACTAYSQGLVDRYGETIKEVVEDPEQRKSLSITFSHLFSYIHQNSLNQDHFINTLVRHDMLTLDGIFKEVFEQVTNKVGKESPYSIANILDGQVNYNSSYTDITTGTIKTTSNRVYLTVCKKIRKQDFRTSSSHYDEANFLHPLMKPKTLVIINDENKMMTSWIRGISGVGDYDTIWRLDFNHVYVTPLVRKMIKDILTTSLSESSKLMFASELKKPEEVKIVQEDGTVVESERVAAVLPGIRTLPLGGIYTPYNEAEKVVHKYDDDGKRVPFNKEYLVAEDENVIVYTREHSRHSEYKIHAYLSSFKTPPASCMYITTDTQYSLVKAVVKEAGKRLITFGDLSTLTFDHLDQKMLKQAVVLSTILKDLPNNGARVLYLKKYAKDYDTLELEAFTNQLAEERYYYSHYSFIPDQNIRNLIYHFSQELESRFKDELKTTNVMEEASREELADIIRTQLTNNTFLLEVFNQLIKKEEV